MCLHSSGGSSSQWRRLVESGKDACRFLAFDFHGHGRSEEDGGEDYALRCESDAVWGSIESVREPVHLVGHSFGGAVALDLAEDFRVAEGVLGDADRCLRERLKESCTVVY